MLSKIIGKCKGVEFDEEKDSTKLMFVLFKEEWCSTCKSVEHILKKIKDLGIPIYVLSISDNVSVSEKYSVKYPPTVLVLNEGIIMDHIIGLHNKDRYLRSLSLL